MSERNDWELGSERTVDGPAVLTLISQADLLAGNEVRAVVIDDTIVDGRQLVPVMERIGAKARDEMQRSFTWRRPRRLRSCHSNLLP